jgi:hypothetical protein
VAPPRSKRTGRPPLDPNDPSTELHIRLPSKQYDALYAVARQRRLTVAEAARLSIRRLLRDANQE